MKIPWLQTVRVDQKSCNPGFSITMFLLILKYVPFRYKKWNEQLLQWKLQAQTDVFLPYRHTSQCGSDFCNLCRATIAEVPGKKSHIKSSKLKLTEPHCCEKKWDRNTLTVLTCFGFAVRRWIWFSSAMYTTTRGLVHYIRTIAKACQRRMQMELILMTTATIPRQFMPLLELEGSAWTNSLRLW